MKAVMDLSTGLRKNNLHNGFGIVLGYTIRSKTSFFFLSQNVFETLGLLLVKD